MTAMPKASAVALLTVVCNRRDLTDEQLADMLRVAFIDGMLACNGADEAGAYIVDALARLVMHGALLTRLLADATGQSVDQVLFRLAQTGLDQ